jgi:predicted DNA-binding transcriptional regulator AlpA
MKRKPHHKNGRDQARAQPDLFSGAGRAAPATMLDVQRPQVRVGGNAATADHKLLPRPAPVVVRPANGLLRVREAAARLGLSKSTLDKMRCDGRGPRFVKITNKLVGYDPTDLDAYADSRKRQSTSEA